MWDREYGNADNRMLAERFITKPRLPCRLLKKQNRA
jgi:hypothetical protein